MIVTLVTRKSRAVVVMLFSLLFFAGCATGRYSEPMNDRSALLANKNSATVVFMRPSKMGYAIASSVFDVTSGKAEMLGIPGPGEKMAFAVEPGKRRFMVVAENADFLEADLQAGKTYYSAVVVRAGVWKARFGLTPLKADGSDGVLLSSDKGRKWLGATEYVASSEKAQAWGDSNAEGIEKKRAKYMTKWESNEGRYTSREMLEPGDGVSTPVD